MQGGVQARPHCRRRGGPGLVLPWSLFPRLLASRPVLSAQAFPCMSARSLLDALPSTYAGWPPLQARGPPTYCPPPQTRLLTFCCLCCQPLPL